MFDDILTPMNHREIEYNAKKLSGCDIPDSFSCARRCRETLSLACRIDSAQTGEKNCALCGDTQTSKGTIQQEKQMLLKKTALCNWLEETGARVFDDDLVMDYGTDCLRLYLLFEQTPKENDAPYYESWQEGALEGIYKFLGRTRRMLLAADLWNRKGHYNEETFPAESVRRLEKALETTDAKIRSCICRGNTMPNRHHIVAALMTLLTVFQKELKTSDIISELRSHAVETAVPHGRAEAAHEMHEESDAHFHPDVAECCRKFVILLAPYAPDLCKLLWVRLK